MVFFLCVKSLGKLVRHCSRSLIQGCRDSHIRHPSPTDGHWPLFFPFSVSVTFPKTGITISSLLFSVHFPPLAIRVLHLLTTTRSPSDPLPATHPLSVRRRRRRASEFHLVAFRFPFLVGRACWVTSETDSTSFSFSYWRLNWGLIVRSVSTFRRSSF